VTPAEMRALGKAGAVGEVVGWAFDAKGELIDGLTNDRVASVPLDRPASRTRPASTNATSACETVGLDRSLSRAIWARETGPICRTNSSTERSLIAFSRLGVPAANG